MLNEQQQKAAKEIETLRGKHKGMHTLMGYAGTGKSYMCGYLASQVFRNPCMCSPTNKASRVLSKFTGKEAITLAQALCLRLDKGSLMQYADPMDKLKEHDVLIIDEASMLGKSYMKRLQEQVDIPILFIGDPEQLPPVKEEHEGAPAFKVKDKSMLTQIVRQAEGNPLIAYSMKIRTEGFDEDIPVDGESIIAMEDSKAIPLSVAAAKSGSSFVVAAWRNKTVDAHNLAVHRLLHPDGSEFSEGEKIVFQAPTKDPLSGEILFSNGDEAIVQKVRDSVWTTPEGSGVELRLPAWLVTLDTGDVVKVLKRTSKQNFQSHIDGLFQRGMAPLAWSLIESVSDIKHTYAMTVHKLQGSTYDAVGVKTQDLLSCPIGDIRRKLAYVAVTRAKKKVVFFV